ncbi:MAG TPA: hypothetical protein VM032_01945 [Vicinamibacterales bacterium]|nr:hypothetical protein [Vicinamibacterales bacterium]
MGASLDTFKQYKATLDELATLARTIEASIQSTRTNIDALMKPDSLGGLIDQQERWLTHTERAVTVVRDWYERDRRAHWPRLAWRWVAATAFALVASAAAGAGFVWASRPYAAEIEYLRDRNAFADSLEARMLKMTPAERRQLDAFLNVPALRE